MKPVNFLIRGIIAKARRIMAMIAILINIVLFIPQAPAAAQGAFAEAPMAIAPIEAPFEMPQLKRPAFPERSFNIRNYGAVPCQWEDNEKHKSTEAIHKAIQA